MEMNARRFKPYPAYKDSGVEWLGEIPSHWEVKKIKRFCLVRRGASPRPIDDPIYFDDEGEYAWVRIADVTASERYLNRTTQRLSPLGKSRSVALEPGELFVSIAATVGKPVITKIKCCIHRVYTTSETGCPIERGCLSFVLETKSSLRLKGEVALVAGNSHRPAREPQVR